MLDTLLQGLYFAGVVAASVVRLAGVRGAQRGAGPTAKSQATATDRALMSLPALGMFVAPIVYAATSWLDFADYHLPSSARVTAGLAGAGTFAAGIWLLWRSHADLGRQWSSSLELKEQHTLVTEGVYRHIRHPMYAAHVLWGIAQVLLLQNWVAGPAMLLTQLPLLLVRVPQEERMMLLEFGDEYRQYMARTGRLMPRLGR